MAIPATTIDVDLEAVKAAQADVEPRPGRVLLFGSRARGDARPDSDIDLLVVMPQQPTLAPQGRQQALRSLRPLSSSVGVDLVVVGEEDARRLILRSSPMPNAQCPMPILPLTAAAMNRKR